MNKQNPKVLNDFLSYLLAFKNYSKGTVKAYNMDLILFFRFIIKYLGLEIEVKDINIFILASVKQSDIIAFLVYLNYEKQNLPETRNRKLAAIKSFFKYLYNQYPKLSYKLNPAQNISSAELMYRLPKYLKLEDAKKLQHIFNINNSRNALRNNTIITLFLNSGLRLSELTNINVKDIKFKNKTLKVIGKGNKERVVFLNTKTIEAINKYLKTRNNLTENDALFITYKNKRISNTYIEKICKEAFKLAGLEEYGYTVHSLRHTAATYLYKETKNILITKEFLGHSTIEATQIYTHIENESIREAVNKNPLSNYVYKGGR